MVSEEFPIDPRSKRVHFHRHYGMVNARVRRVKLEESIRYRDSYDRPLGNRYRSGRRRLSGGSGRTR